MPPTVACRAARALPLLLLLAGCRDRAAPPPDETMPAAPPPPERVVRARIEAPDSLGWNERAIVRLAVENDTEATLRGAVAHLRVPLPVAALRDSLPPGTRADSTATGTDLAFPLDSVGPGGAAYVAQFVRMPPVPRRPAPQPGARPAPTTGGDTARAFVVGMWVTGADGALLTDTARHVLNVRAGSDTVVGGCAQAAGSAVQRYGIGPVRVGMTADALRRACPDARDTAWTAAGGARETGLVLALGDAPVVAGTDRGGVVRWVRVDAPGPRTAVGVGVGSTLGQLRARYGRMCAGREGGSVAVWFPVQPGLRFAVDTTDARGLPAGPPDAAALPDSLRIGALSVREDDDDCPARPGEAGVER